MSAGFILVAVTPAWGRDDTCALDTEGVERRRGRKKKRKQKRQESLNSLFMCLPLHLHCTAELLPSALGLGEAGNAKHRGVDADGKRRV